MGHVSHARSLVEDAADATDDDDVSPTATGINLSKWRGRQRICIHNRSWVPGAMPNEHRNLLNNSVGSSPRISRGKSPDGAFVSDVRGPTGGRPGANFGFCIF